MSVLVKFSLGMEMMLFASSLKVVMSTVGVWARPSYTIQLPLAVPRTLLRSFFGGGASNDAEISCTFALWEIVRVHPFYTLGAQDAKHIASVTNAAEFF